MFMSRAARQLAQFWSQASGRLCSRRSTSVRVTPRQILTTIGAEGGCGDKSRFIRCEEDDATRDFTRFTKPSNRDLREKIFLQNILRHGLHHFCVDVPRADCVYSYAESSTFLGRALVNPRTPAFAAG